MLTAGQIAAREGRLTASRVACLMEGNEAAILDLWREMVGDPTFVSRDLSGAWPVQLGIATEALNLRWYERKTGRPLSRQGEVVIHPSVQWAACTLDAWDGKMECPVEAKHVGGREALGTIVARYWPQLAWQMEVTGAEQAVLSVIEGGNEPVIEVVDRDAAYADELWSRARAFMACVDSLTPPVADDAVSPPVKAERVIDMFGQNEWASEAVVWLENREAGKRADAAEKALKSLMPADAARCHGYGVEIIRNRAGRLTLKEIRP